MPAIRYSVISVFLILLWFGFVSCNSRPEQKQQNKYITVVDDLGRELQIPRQPQRIMGLAPSATEMLYAVAEEKNIVGRTQNCDYPAKVKNKPVVNNYPMDYEQVILLKPDLVFTVEGITSAEEAAKLQELNIPVYFQRFTKVQDIFDGLQDIGRLLHREERAQEVVDSLRAVLKQIKVEPVTEPKPRVLAITYPNPIYVYGQNTIFSDKLKLINAENAVTEVFAQPYPALTREYILKLNPDVIIGGGFEKMDATFFKMYPELKKIKAYQQKRIFAATDDLMSRPSPRVVTSIQELKKLIW